MNVMRRPTFIAKQASRPTGLAGRVLTAIMALETKRFNSEVLKRVLVRPEIGRASCRERVLDHV